MLRAVCRRVLMSAAGGGGGAAAAGGGGAAAVATASPDVLHASKAAEKKLDDLSPRKIAEILDRYIVGQSDGKRAVAISLRNRWRRRQLPDADMRREVLPKNMLLIGPTGVGKTEISRRMARITDAPFVKVEATKYTEVGFKGKDVESIIEDLYSNAKTKARKALEAERHEEALAMAVDTVYSAWSTQRRMRAGLSRGGGGGAMSAGEGSGGEEGGGGGTTGWLTRAKRAASRKMAAAAATAATTPASEGAAAGEGGEATREGGGDAAASTAAAEKKPVRPHEVTLEYFREHYTDEFKDDLVVIDVAAPPEPQRPSPHGMHPHHHPGGGGGGGLSSGSVGFIIGMGAEQRRPRIVVRKRVVEAVPLAMQEALGKLIDDAQVNTLARALAEEEGIVFIDEIDKVVADRNSQSADVSSTGVQQDLLPLIEGSNVTMKDGSVIATDNILFICSGAFHTAKTSDMIAELQGRLPVRVELKPLSEDDFRRILTEPKYNLLLQQKEMMATEGVTVVFADDGVRALARVTSLVNTQGQNIGARRLNTVLERVMDKYSFDCDDYAGKTVVIDEAAVREATEKLQKNVDLAKYLL